MLLSIRRWFAALFLVTLAASGAAAQNANTREYVIGAGDVIRVNVFQSPDLSVETRVSESGNVTYPLLGQVQVGGLTVVQAEKRIADGLRSGNFVKQPQVSILLVQVRGNQASVLGQVNRPGRYPLEMANTKLSDLLAMAGGVAGAGADTIIVSGMRNGKPFRNEIDLPSIFVSGKSGDDIAIQNGDVVYVDRMPTVYIYGEVQRPGALRLERNMSVMQALATGGGLTQRGTEKGLRVHRRGPDGRVQVIQPTMEDILRDGDVVYVRESLF
ncbi:polysaccharide export protein EpsE [Aquabacterium sp. A7-Y]|uniref:polysaccharide export protein EpsE n=1 Tax=Aquabacterium sp. A7-Y TaxID=1349605 RepID=UPI00223D664B|nr:polysaccharide export protein EpsE [Aquabacterium sp. A7-Y]MCW7537312.1 polysaccharide export protein EpsE [Aquabacterium sp. A7-Y]